MKLTQYRERDAKFNIPTEKQDMTNNSFITYYCPCCGLKYSYLHDVDAWGMLINHLRNKHRVELMKSKI